MSEVYVIGASCTGLGTRAGTGSQAQYRCGRGAEQVLAGRQVGLPLSRVTRAMRSLPGEGAAAASSASTREGSMRDPVPTLAVMAWVVAAATGPWRPRPSEPFSGVESPGEQTWIPSAVSWACTA